MNDINNNYQIKLTNYQFLGIFLFIITLFISLLLTYNEKLKLEKKDIFFEEKTSLYISLFNRIIVLILAILFIYISYEREKVSEVDNDASLELLASYLSFFASFLALYIVIKNINNKNFDVSDVEEPTL
mgnify:FL=1